MLSYTAGVSGDGTFTQANSLIDDWKVLSSRRLLKKKYFSRSDWLSDLYQSCLL